MNLKDTYNRIAEAWHTDHTSDTWWVAGTDYFVSLLPKGGKVLDAGCGSGVKSKYLALKGLTVTGIDFSENMIAIAKREVPEANFMVHDLYELDTIGQTFDGVFMQASLLHIPKEDAREVLRKAVSVLSAGGLLYVAVKGVRDGGPQEEIKKETDYGYEYERFFSYYTMEELCEHMEELGLSVVWKDISPTNATAWLQVVGKK